MTGGLLSSFFSNDSGGEEEAAARVPDGGKAAMTKTRATRHPTLRGDELGGEVRSGAQTVWRPEISRSCVQTGATGRPGHGTTWPRARPGPPLGSDCEAWGTESKYLGDSLRGVPYGGKKLTERKTFPAKTWRAHSHRCGTLA